MKPVKPVFKLLDTGNAVLDREGSLFLEFAPPVAQRQYDWNSKQIFALSVMELGTLVGLAPGESCEFYHDPNMGKSDAGKIRKSLKVNPMKDEDGYYFNLNRQSHSRFMANLLESTFELNKTVRLHVVTSILSCVQYIIPYLMGWHVFVDPSTVDDFLADDEPVGSMTTKNEWDK
ncbi:hypothetical protein AXG93_4012s1240 [Marchantia polymorpha subsp. ruderalis]|uniref:Uncharacterized protein n=1 Tax=Marchantia polymorpha subsp. ruderalis TaxID=1480154 RepID=A0A176VLB3_MARPO|nr:hypothetical protein AXG93_4012s1240 [Marchantia polymorpha subsp. ruderalis]